MNKNKRIAICFFGETRAPSIINKIYKSIENKYDYFISTWDDEESQKLNLKFITKKILNYKKTWEEELWSYERKYWGEEKIPHTKNPNQIFATYHIKKVLRAKREYEIEKNFKYDLVLLIRPDVLPDFNILEKHFNDLAQLNFLKKPIVSLQLPLEIRDRNKISNQKGLESKFIFLPKDHSYIMNSAGSDLLCSWFDDFYIYKKDHDINLQCTENHSMAAFPFVYYNFLVLNSFFRLIIVRRHRDNPVIEHLDESFSYNDYDRIVVELSLNKKKWIFDKKKYINSETGVKLTKKFKIIE